MTALTAQSTSKSQQSHSTAQQFYLLADDFDPIKPDAAEAQHLPSAPHVHHPFLIVAHQHPRPRESSDSSDTRRSKQNHHARHHPPPPHRTGLRRPRPHRHPHRPRITHHLLPHTQQGVQKLRLCGVERCSDKISPPLNSKKRGVFVPADRPIRQVA